MANLSALDMCIGGTCAAGGRTSDHTVRGAEALQLTGSVQTGYGRPSDNG